MGASHDILREVVTLERFQHTEIAMVSRCDYPPWAAACMRLFDAAPGVTLADATTYSVQLMQLRSCTMHVCWLRLSLTAAHSAATVPDNSRVRHMWCVMPSNAKM